MKKRIRAGLSSFALIFCFFWGIAYGESWLDDEVTLEYLGSTLWSVVNDVDVVGNTAYCASNYGLLILDLGNLDSIYQVSEVYIPEVESHDLVVKGEYVYLIADSLGLYVINISDINSPFISGMCVTPGNANKIDVDQDIACILDGDSGLQIIDIADPQNPYIVGNYPTSGQANDVIIEDKYAYIADDSNGLKIIDIAIPEAPILLSTWDTRGLTRSIQLKNDTIFIADGPYGIQILDVSDPLLPDSLGGYYADTLTEFYDKFAISDNYIFVEIYVYYTSLLKILDWSDINSIHQEFNLVLHDYYEIQKFDLVEDTLYITYGGDGLDVMDVSNVHPPHIIGNFAVSGVGDIYLDDEYAYTVSGRHMKIFDISNPISPLQLSNYSTLERPISISIDGATAYIGEGKMDISGNLEKVNISDLTNPAFIGSTDYTGNVRDILAFNDSLFLAIGRRYTVSSGKFYFIDYNSGQQALCNTADTWGLTYNNGYTYLADTDWGFMIINTVDITNVTLEGSCPELYGSRYIDFSNGYAYIGAWSNGLYIVNCSDPAAPFLEYNYLPEGNIYDVEVAGNYCFAANGTGGLKILNIKNPSMSYLVGNYDTGGNLISLAIRNNLLVVSDNSGLFLFQISITDFICGDANFDENVNVSDAVYIINYIFVGGTPPSPWKAGDANCDNSVNVSDAVWIINYVFIGGNEPCDTDGNGVPDC